MTKKASVYLHILGEGETKSALANNRGHLFELLMRDLFKSLKVEITHINRRKHGTEIDIEGKHFVNKAPVLAECKTTEDAISSEDIQKFAFKILHERNKNENVSGFFLSTSNLNAAALELWEELKETYGDSLTKYVEDELVELIIEHMGLFSPYIVREKASSSFTRDCGDTLLLCMEDRNKSVSLFWAQLLMSTDGTEPNLVAFYSSSGDILSSESVINQLRELDPYIHSANLECVNLQSSTAHSVTFVDDVSPSRAVVRVRKSKDWFDYRFPSAPEFFVGRIEQRDELLRFIEEVQDNKTGTRGVYFSGKSGIGKSSLALKCQQDLNDHKTILLPIDCRLCDDISFLFDSVNELLFELRKLDGVDRQLKNVHVHGLDSLIETLSQIHDALEKHDYYAIVFFDQFERVFDYPEVTRGLRNLFLRVTERQLRVLFGFAWKSDLWSQAEGFPHSERDDIVRESYSIRPLVQFGKEETEEILNKLELQWGEKLSGVLRLQLAVFSRGLPWLLKKVCAHVLEQKHQGATQDELIETNLKLQDLFEADLAGLDDEERALLRAIAPLLPATLRRLSESFEIAHIDQALHRFIDKRILVKITEDIGESYANVKYDAYSDIFREFLVTGTTPLEEAYYFFSYPKGGLKFFNKVKERGSLSIEQDIAESGRQMASIYNLSRDLRQLGLLEMNNRVFTVPSEVATLNDEDLLPYLQRKLKQNRLVSLALSEINTYQRLSLDSIAQLLQDLFPSVKAREETWLYYSRTTAKWLHEARLAYYSSAESVLHQVDDEDVFERAVTRGSLQGKGFRFPLRFKNAIVDCIETIHQSGRDHATVDQLVKWLNKKHQTVEMILSDCLNLSLVHYDENSECYQLTDIGKQFAESSEPKRREIFGVQCQTIDIYNEFIKTVDSAGEGGFSHRGAVDVALKGIDVEFADATIDKLGAILSNWAEYAGVINRVGRRCIMAKYLPKQLDLFAPIEAKQ